MSKKDKDKRKKGSGKDPGSAWIADLRRPAPSSIEAAPPSEPEEDDDDVSAPTTRRSSPLPPPDAGYVAIPRPSALPNGMDLPPSLPNDDAIGDETFSDIAPIGPTEYAGAGMASVAPETESGPATPRPGPTVDQLEQQIRDLEARLDEMIGRHDGPRPEKAARPGPAAEEPPAPTRASPIAPRPATPAAAAPIPPPRPSNTGATANEVLSSDFYLRHWGRTGMRKRSEEVDEYGHDPAYEAKYIPFFDFLYKTYFRVDAEGTASIPEEGRCLLVSNHSGGPLPYDGVMLRTVLRKEHPGARELRWLAEDFIYYLPFVGSMMNRLGAVRACQENAERLLGQGRLVAVFPEGAKGIGKLYKDRYRLQRFGRGGFIRLCLRTQTPIIPTAIVGAEEANPMLYRLEYMARTLGIPYLPITPTFPALGPLGLLPAPTKWKVAFGEPIRFDSYGPEAADDDILVGRLAERVRATIQSMLDRMIATRRSIWFG